MDAARRRTILLAAPIIAVVVTAAGVAAVLMTRPEPARRAVSIEDFTPGPDGRALVVRYLAPSRACSERGGVVVRSQTASEIRLEAFVEYKADEDGTACPLAAHLETAQVRLDDDFAERRVVDATTGRALPVAPRRPRPGPSPP